MEKVNFLNLVKIFKQPHLARRILNYIGNFKDIKNLALASLSFYNALKGKNFCLCLNIPYFSNDVDIELESNFDKEECDDPCSSFILWIGPMLDLSTLPITITELELPFVNYMDLIAPTIMKVNIEFPNLQSFSWNYSCFAFDKDREIMLYQNSNLIDHILKGLKYSKKLRYFRFYFSQVIVNKRSINNEELNINLIRMIIKYVSSNVRKIDFGNFDIFTSSMVEDINEHFENLCQFTLYKVNIENDVSFENFRNLNYLYLPCFEKDINIPRNLKVLVVRCSNYEAKIDYEEGDDIDVTDIEYPCNCRTVGRNFSYSINHNVGISLHRLTIYFNNPTLYDFYYNKLPDRTEMYIPNFNYTGNRGNKRCSKAYYLAM